MARCLEVATRRPLAPPPPGCGGRAIGERSGSKEMQSGGGGLPASSGSRLRPLTRIKSGAGSLPARGERWRKWLCLAPQDTNAYAIATPHAGELAQAARLVRPRYALTLSPAEAIEMVCEFSFRWTARV